MVDQAGIGRIVASCQRYWREAGLSAGVISEMAGQLEEHLREAAAAGKPLESVVGRDLRDFAEAWAAETQDRMPRRISNSARASRPEKRRSSQRELVLYGLGIVAVVIAVGMSRGETSVDNDIWRWLWTGLAVVMGVGEIFTAGFFLLPFAVGATAAAVLAWTGVGVVSQWLVFFGVSLVAFVYLRRFIARQDETGPSVGANRWANSRGVVLTAIEPLESTGIVRIGGEEWRATADQPIPAGTQVVVLEVSGSRLVVMPLET